MAKTALRTKLSKRPNAVEIHVGGYILDVKIVQGKLQAFVYRQELRMAGAVAMAYDGLLPHERNVAIRLTGEETP